MLSLEQVKERLEGIINQATVGSISTWVLAELGGLLEQLPAETEPECKACKDKGFLISSNRPPEQGKDVDVLIIRRCWCPGASLLNLWGTVSSCLS